jgi:hypothetical protein
VKKTFVAGRTFLKLRCASRPLPLCCLPVPLQLFPCDPLRGPNLRCCQGRFPRTRRAFLQRQIPRRRFAALPPEHARDLRHGCSNACRYFHAFDGTSDPMMVRVAAMGLSASIPNRQCRSLRIGYTNSGWTSKFHRVSCACAVPSAQKMTKTAKAALSDPSSSEIKTRTPPPTVVGQAEHWSR